MPFKTLVAHIIPIITQLSYRILIKKRKSDPLSILTFFSPIERLFVKLFSQLLSINKQNHFPRV